MELTIHHLDCHYLARSSEENAVRSRFDRVATDDLLAALGNWIEPLPGDDDALYFIDRVEIDATIDARCDDRGLAQHWAEALLGGLTRRLQANNEVVVFQNRAEYIAQFLMDLASGCAESIWYYRELLSPDALPLSQRATQVLTADPDTGRDAIFLVHRGGRTQDLLFLLGDTGVSEVVSRCILPASPDVFSSASIQAWSRAIRNVLAAGKVVPSGRPAEDILLLYVEILSAKPELGPDVNLARFLSRLLELKQTCTGLPTLLQAMFRGDWDAIRPLLASTEQARFVASAMHAVQASEFAALVQRLQTDAGGSVERSFITEHAGMFLLAHAALEIDFAARLAPLGASGPDANLPVYLVALQCLGAENAARSFADSGVAAFAGLIASPARDELAGALADWSVPAAAISEESWFALALPELPVESMRGIDEWLRPLSRDLLEAFARRLGAFAGSSPDYLYRNFLHCRGLVNVSPGRVSVRFLTCPMRIVLRMAGFGGSPLAIPWADVVWELNLD